MAPQPAAAGHPASPVLPAHVRRLWAAGRCGSSVWPLAMLAVIVLLAPPPPARAQFGSPGGWDSANQFGLRGRGLYTPPNRTTEVVDAGNPWKTWRDHLLERPTSCDFQELPLDECLGELARQSGFQFTFDKRALEDAGIDSQTPVTLTVREVSLRMLLKLLLEPLDLTWAPRDSVLQITSTEQAWEVAVVRVYPVADLVTLGSDFPDFDSLIEIITSTVGPSTWDEVGGPGTIQQFPGVLVISQIEQVHHQIEQLLAALRRAIDTDAAPFRPGNRAPRRQVHPPASKAQSRLPAALVTAEPVRRRLLAAEQLAPLFPGAKVVYEQRR